MLDAVLTRDVPADRDLGAYALLLDPKGRVLADLEVIRDEEDVLLVAEDAGAQSAAETLGRYAPFSRVKVGDAGMAVVGVYGPGARSLPGLDLSGKEHRRVTFESGTGEVAATAYVPSTGPSGGVCLLVPEESAPRLFEAVLALGTGKLREEEYETARIVEARPRFGTDVTASNFPAEAYLDRSAVSFDKGCYPGQETVARMHYRGQPNKHLHRFTVEGEATPGAEVLQNDRAVGYLTSVAPLAVGGKTYALGYLKRRADLAGELRSEGATLTVSPPELPQGPKSAGI